MKKHETVTLGSVEPYASMHTIAPVFSPGDKLQLTSAEGVRVVRVIEYRPATGEILVEEVSSSIVPIYS